MQVFPMCLCHVGFVAYFSTMAGMPLLAQSPVVRDSAGVRIVENPSRATAPELFKARTAAFEVGGLEDDPDVEFDHNQGYLRGVRLSNGGLAVIDVFRVHYFDAKGKRRFIVGRKGRGPEEMLYATAICRTRGDTVLVGDSHNRRISVLDETGRIVRTIPYGDMGSPQFDFCFDDGTFVLQGNVATSRDADPIIRITRLSTIGAVVNIAGEFPGYRFDFVTQSQVSVVAAGNRLYYANPTTSEVLVYSADGKLQSRIRSTDPVDPISESEAERRILMTIPTNVQGAQRTQQIERARAMPRSRTWPTYSRIAVDPAGQVWVQDFRRNYPAPDGWTAFDASGRLIGRFVIPSPAAGQRPALVIGFGVNEVMLRETDADGGSKLVVYGLRK